MVVTPGFCCADAPEPDVLQHHDQLGALHVSVLRDVSAHIPAFSSISVAAPISGGAVTATALSAMPGSDTPALRQAMNTAAGRNSRIGSRSLRDV